MMYVILFILGLVTGMLLTCLIQTNREDREEYYYDLTVDTDISGDGFDISDREE